MGAHFESHDLDEIEDFIAKSYAPIRFSAGTPARTHFLCTRNPVGPVSLDLLDYGFAADYAVEPLGRIALFSVESGAFPWVSTDGHEDSHGVGDVFLTARPDRPYAGRECNARFGITMVEPSLLSQVAAPKNTSAPVRLTGYRPVSPEAGARLLRTITFLRNNVAAEPAFRDAPLIASTAPQLLAAIVLRTFPNNALTDPTANDRNDAHPASLRRAVAFIDDNAHRDITVADIASAAHVTIRTVQYAFRRHLGISPTAYLRRVRLEHAHRALLTTDPTEGATVTRIAADWGFLHPGRFAQYHRTVYGCAPHRILHHKIG
jgi:AraC-like DNA-binding protein